MVRELYQEHLLDRIVCVDVYLSFIFSRCLLSCAGVCPRWVTIASIVARRPVYLSGRAEALVRAAVFRLAPQRSVWEVGGGRAWAYGQANAAPGAPGVYGPVMVTPVTPHCPPLEGEGGEGDQRGPGEDGGTEVPGGCPASSGGECPVSRPSRRPLPGGLSAIRSKGVLRVLWEVRGGPALVASWGSIALEDCWAGRPFWW